MSEPRKTPFPAWLDRIRRADARRWAKMSPEEIAADIHERAKRPTPLLSLKQRHRAGSG